MKRKITPSDVFDINKKSGALILGKNRLDDYATKFLTKYCKQALVEPMPLPVDDILKDMGLTVQEVHLSSDLDVFGCCLLLDADVDIRYIQEMLGHSSINITQIYTHVTTAKQREILINKHPRKDFHF